MKDIINACIQLIIEDESGKTNLEPLFQMGGFVKVKR